VRSGRVPEENENPWGGISQDETYGEAAAMLDWILLNKNPKQVPSTKNIKKSRYMH
jgi:hypothetical protein